MSDQDPADAIRARIAAVEAEIARLEGERERLGHALNVLQGLTESKDKINTGGMIHKSKVRHSAGRGKQSPLVKAANAANMTMDEVAAVLKCSSALLSAAAHGKKSISMAYAKRVETLLGVDSKGNPRYPATLASWPMLRQE